MVPLIQPITSVTQEQGDARNKPGNIFWSYRKDLKIDSPANYNKSFSQLIN